MDRQQKEGYRQRLRHSAAHVLAEAVLKLRPDAKLTIGPPIENGFYYDFDLKEPLSDTDLGDIERLMAESIKADSEFVEQEVSREEARAKVKHNEYKCEILDGITAEQRITLVSHSDGAFEDLCVGGHLERTGQIKAFKLLKTAGAYWRGDENRPMLQRVYGTAWENKNEQDAYLERLARAEEADHRRLGKQLGLFVFSPYAPASPFFLPKGTRVINGVTRYIRGLYGKYGYDEVITPQIFDSELWKVSGHYENYAENMYFVELDKKQYAIKPMNCPAAALMYKSELRSYRDLPLRWADFGRLHRYERSGVVHGLTRVRSFSQDDAHIFCTEDQMVREITSCLEMFDEVYSTFEFGEPRYMVSLRPAKRVGDENLWNRAEKVLTDTLRAHNKNFEEADGEGAFYGPKIDALVPDAIGRHWQLGTIQLDFVQPERFDLNYIAEQGAKRPVVVHRTVIGSLERFFGVLLEHVGGKLPLWLAPLQVRLIPIADRHNDYAASVVKRLQNAEFYCESDDSNERMNNKIRKAQQMKVPLMAVVGDREQTGDQVAIRLQDGTNLGAIPVDDLIARLRKACESRQPFE